MTDTPLPAARIGREYREHFFLALDLHHEMHREPAVVERLLLDAARRRGAFRDAVAGATRPRSASAARGAAIQALRRGLMCGTLDGLALLGANRAPLEAPMPVADTAIVRRLDNFVRRQRRACTTARKDLAVVTVEGLNASVEFRLDLAGAAVSEAAAPGVPLQEFRNLQARVWQLGYELGISNAALVSGAYGRLTPRRAPVRRTSARK